MKNAHKRKLPHKTGLQLFKPITGV